MDILTLAQSKTQLKKIAGTHGGEWVGACPTCGGTDRFHVWPEKRDSRRSERVGIYWCRGCGLAGDVVQWFVHFEGMDYAAAFRALGEEMPDGYRQRYAAPRIPGAAPACTLKSDVQAPAAAAPDQPAAWLERATALVAYAEGQLAENKFALKWLKKRGITKKTAIGMRLGWHDEDRFRPRESWGLPAEIKDDGKPKKLWLPAGLVIPLIEPGPDGAGIVRRVRIRRFTEREPRYYVLPGSRMACMAHGLPHRAAVIVESELDAIMLIAQADAELAAVVALGSATAKPGPALQQALAACVVVLVALDSDRAGASAMAWWRENLPQSKRWPVPTGKDPGEAFAAGVDVAAWVKAGLPAAWFLGPSPVGLVAARAGVVEGDDGKAATTAAGSAHTPSEQAVSPAAESDGAGSGTISGVEELAALLRLHPVQIRIAADASRVWIRENQNWKAKNWDTARRISELVFQVPGVLDHLIGLGVEIVDQKNILKGGIRVQG